MSKDESKLLDIPCGKYCYSFTTPDGFKCSCELDCNCDISLVKKFCPYYFYIDNGLTKCTLLNITSDDDDCFSSSSKVCGFNEFDEEIK